MKDRVGKYPGRYLIKPLDGSEPFEAELEWADEPIEVGTPFASISMLRDATAELYGMSGDATPDDVFAYIGQLLRSLGAAAKNDVVPVSAGGTGVTNLTDLRNTLGIGPNSTLSVGKVIGAVYQ